MIKNRFCQNAALAAAAVVTLSTVSFAATPKPPVSICIDGACTSTPTQPSSKAVKYHPGIYVWYAPGSSNGIAGQRWDLPDQRAAVLSFYDSICKEPGIRGMQLIGLWRTFEGPTAGDYNAGFAAVDAAIAKLASCNKKLMLVLQTVWFGNWGNSADIPNFYPAYIVNGSQYGITYMSPGLGLTARTWQQATNDRQIALIKAYGARYNANPTVEMISVGESSLQVQSDGFNQSINLDQTKRLITESRAAWPNTAIRVMVNDGFSDAGFIDFYNHCKLNYCSLGGPDTWPGDITQADRLFVGKNSSGATVYEDLRDKLPWAVNVDWQSFNLSGNSPLWSLQQLWDAPHYGYTPTNPNGEGNFAMPTMKVRYHIWYANYANGNSQNQWSTALLPFLRSKAAGDPSLTFGCPTAYPGCNTN